MTPKQIRAGHLQFIAAIGPTGALTLGEGRFNSLTSMPRLMTLFLNKVQRVAYGRNWYRKPPDQRLSAIGFREHAQTNAHWHLAVAADEDLRRALYGSESIWAEVRPGGHWYFDGVENGAQYA